MWLQKRITLAPKSRGFHLVTEEVLAQCTELVQIETGLAHFLLQHTSASLGLNENADSSVRHDLESHLDVIAPENAPYYRHTCEGADDMPAHIKSGLLGSELTLPVRHGRLVLGTWQGLILGEHRNHGGPRSLILTLTGQRHRTQVDGG